MFKRVEKRRRKKEKEEELGLDEEMKEILGMQDTDSEEGSSSDGDQEDDESDDEELGQDAVLDEEDEEGESDEGEEPSAAEEEEEEDDPAINVSEALKDPVYVVSIQPEDYKWCKFIGNLTHAHQRRYKRFQSYAKAAQPSESAWELLVRHAEQKPKLLAQAPSQSMSEGASSNRAAKKKLHWQKKREKVKARKAAAAVVSDSDDEDSIKQGDPEGVKKANSENTKAKKRIDIATDSPPKKKSKMDREAPKSTSSKLKAKPSSRAREGTNTGMLKSKPSKTKLKS